MTIRATYFRALGTTDESTTCDQCGRTELKSTYVIEELDEDGGHLGIIYAGSTCGPRLIKARSAIGQNVKIGTLRKEFEHAASVLRVAREWRKEAVQTYGTEPTKAGLLTYARHNGHAIRSYEQGKRFYDELMNDIAKIGVGELRGTRFERQLRTI